MPVSLTQESVVRHEEHHSPKRGKSGMRWIVLAVLLAGAIAVVYFFGWLPRQRQTEAIDKEAQQRTTALPRLPVVKVKLAPASSELLVPGTTLAYTEASLYARASGYVSKRLVDIGDHVRQGQLLATIDSPDLDRQVAQAQSNVAQSEAALGQVEAQQRLAELTWNRWKVLVSKGVFSRQEGDQQEANYRVAIANVNAAKSTVDANKENVNRLLVLQQYERVTAPFSGVITARNIDVGTLIGSGGSGMGGSSPSSNSGSLSAAAQGNNQGSSGNVTSNVSPTTGGSQGGQMFSIASTDRLRILVSVPEAYTSSIRVGQAAELTFPGSAAAHFHGRVTRTSASIDQNTRTLLVEVQVPNNGSLVPGMYTMVNFISIKAQPSVLIPGSAVVIRNAQNSVATVDADNTIRLRPITIGRDYGDQTEVLSGLQPGDAVVLDVTDQVQEGIQVQPEFQADKPAAKPQSQHQAGEASQGRYGNENLTNQAQKTKGGGRAGKGGSGQSSGQSSGKSSEQK